MVLYSEFWIQTEHYIKLLHVGWWTWKACFKMHSCSAWVTQRYAYMNIEWIIGNKFTYVICINRIFPSPNLRLGMSDRALYWADSPGIWFSMGISQSTLRPSPEMQIFILVWYNKMCILMHFDVFKWQAVNALALSAAGCSSKGICRLLLGRRVQCSATWMRWVHPENRRGAGSVHPTHSSSEGPRHSSTHFRERCAAQV